MATPEPSTTNFIGAIDSASSWHYAVAPMPERVSLSAAWSLEALRLPKAIENHAQGAALRNALGAHSQKLWARGVIVVPTATWTPALAAALGDAQREGHLVRGLEQVEKTLEQEARGLSMADARSGTERGARVSRLVLVSADGTERFYRQVERLLRAQGARVLVIQVDADSSQLGGVLSQAAGVVRALMIEHKDSVARVLWASYPSHGDG
jgi:hypothetical protein